MAFRSHLDGRLLELTPERAIAIQEALGADVAMCLDHCPALARRRGRRSPRRWPAPCDGPARASRRAARPDQALFGIVQGGTHADLRQQCAEELVALGFDGYAVGGVSVGESPEEVRKALEVTTPHLPEGEVRYLMGVGPPAGRDRRGGRTGSTCLTACCRPAMAATRRA